MGYLGSRATRCVSSLRRRSTGAVGHMRMGLPVALGDWRLEDLVSQALEDFLHCPARKNVSPWTRGYVWNAKLRLTTGRGAHEGASSLADSWLPLFI